MSEKCVLTLARFGLCAKKCVLVVPVSQGVADRVGAVVARPPGAIEEGVSGQPAEGDSEANVLRIRRLHQMIGADAHAQRFVTFVLAHHIVVEDSVHQLHREAVREDGALPVVATTVRTCPATMVSKHGRLEIKLLSTVKEHEETVSDAMTVHEVIARNQSGPLLLECIDALQHEGRPPGKHQPCSDRCQPGAECAVTLGAKEQESGEYRHRGSGKKVEWRDPVQGHVSAERCTDHLGPPKNADFKFGCAQRMAPRMAGYFRVSSVAREGQQ